MDGVIVPPDANIHHPEFLKALERMNGLYPYIRAIEFVSEWFDSIVHGESELDKETIDKVLEAKRNDLLEVDDVLIDMIMDVQMGVFRKREHSKKSKKDESGFVYLLKGETGQYKIGKAKNPENRLKTFTVKLPFHVEYVCTIRTVDMRELEQALHEQFADKRIDGEWFDLATEDIEYIKAMAS